MAANLETLKSSLRIDGDDDDELLKGYLSAAASYIKQAIGDDNSVPGFYEMKDVSNLFETAVYALAGSYWYYRTSITSNAVNPVDLVLDSIIGQLRGLYNQKQDEVNDNGN
ncbi:head-tail connector protein [Pediococcus acidilactici]|uniref:head-tail connector protein n=1 Tax=Pediococcus acidilactici TaxID=1254 RepID=UPI001310F1C5|nr:head-tail connector protein [Pediococcus acidilactici]KAF0341456.1 phage gp6-like head-tail connector protein [Pediococcus acidilactici]KAF0352985.1 phage gp6-like head-tail connector protein [Pediococcus acidilactici]KAF0356792.1 phage gp6-like head-tail connector protein [Pediococcus acidilactici]KAF0359450.1 phage gp6-like head-tail connector protein [Pediococcus acidilactici]KAF0376863.1 phage gp6-like head-tail connector protein [Pediococcus acidilactici]